MHHQRSPSASCSPVSTKLRFVPPLQGSPRISVPVYTVTDSSPTQRLPAAFSSHRPYSPETPSPKEIAIPPASAMADNYPLSNRTPAAPLAPLMRPEATQRSMQIAKKKPLPPLPGSASTINPLVRAESHPRVATPTLLAPQQSPNRNRATSTSPKLGAIPESPRAPTANSAPVELPAPVTAELDASRPGGVRDEDDDDDEEVHMHAQLLPICPKCARMNPELYWQFPGAGLGVPEMPLTPPDTPESPGRAAVPLEWHTLKQVPESNRNITSWLALTPPSNFIDDAGEDLENDAFNLEAEITIINDDDKTSPSALISPMLGLPSEILLQVFYSLPDLRSVSALSRAHPRLHTLFVENADSIAHTAIGRSSPSLYDLATASGPHSAVQLAEAAAVHKATIQRVKNTIRNRCRFFLSKVKLAPASAADEKAFDDALYLLWNFSNRFGTNAASAGDVESQVAWLRKQDLNMQELKDVLEMYQCIGALLCPLTSDLKAAVQAGVVDVMPVPNMMEEALEQWVMYLQTLGLDKLEAVLLGNTDREQWDAVLNTGLSTIAQGKDIISGRRVFLKSAVGTIVKELCEIERKERLMRKWGEEGVWGPTWES